MPDWKNDRPPNWDRVKPKLNCSQSFGSDFKLAEREKTYFNRGVEAGADAMLEGLRKLSRYYGAEAKSANGDWVFIPDGESK